MMIALSSEVPQARAVVMPGVRRRQARGQRGLAREIPVRRVLDDGARRDFAEFESVQAVLLDQRARVSFTDMPKLPTSA
jgi:hypothetical protein